MYQKPITFDIELMIQLRKEGWGYSALGKKFGKDHTTIMYHCRRLGLSTPKQDGVEYVIGNLEAYLEKTKKKPVPPPPTKKVYKYDYLLYEENANPGKSYKEYLNEALKRPTEKHYHQIYYETHLTPLHGYGHNSLSALSTLIEEEARSEGDATGSRVVPEELPTELRDRDQGDEQKYAGEV